MKFLATIWGMIICLVAWFSSKNWNSWLWGEELCYVNVLCVCDQLSVSLLSDLKWPFTESMLRRWKLESVKTLFYELMRPICWILLCLNKSSNKPLLTSDQIGFGVALIWEMRPSHHNVWNLISSTTYLCCWWRYLIKCCHHCGTVFIWHWMRHSCSSFLYRCIVVIIWLCHLNALIKNISSIKMKDSVMFLVICNSFQSSFSQIFLAWETCWETGILSGTYWWNMLYLTMISPCLCWSCSLLDTGGWCYQVSWFIPITTRVNITYRRNVTHKCSFENYNPRLNSWMLWNIL